MVDFTIIPNTSVSIPSSDQKLSNEIQKNIGKPVTDQNKYLDFDSNGAINSIDRNIFAEVIINKDKDEVNPLELRGNPMALKKEIDKPGKEANDNFIIRSNDMLTKVRMLSDLELAIKQNNDARNALAKQAEEAKDNPKLRLQYHAQEVAKEAEGNRLRKEMDAIKSSLNELQEDKTPYEEAAALAPLESTPENLAQVKVLKAQLKTKNQLRSEIAEESQEAIGDPQKLMMNHQKDTQLQAESTVLSEKIKFMEARLEAGKTPEDQKLNVTPEIIEKRNQILLDKKMNFDARMALAHQAQEAQGNPQLMLHYQMQDAQLQAEANKLDANLKALDEKIHTPKQPEQKTDEKIQKIMQMLQYLIMMVQSMMQMQMFGMGRRF